MSKAAYLDVVRHVGMEGGSRGSLIVRSKSRGMVAVDSDAIAFYGHIELEMDSSMARKLGQALLDCADDAEDS